MTDAELAILSIVAEGPIYGYDIQTVITERGLRNWTNIGISSMYYVLEKLERQGLIDSTPQPGSTGPARRRYRITPAGYGVLQTAVADLLSTPREPTNGFELGLANLHVLRPDQIRTAFASYRQELVSRLGQTHERLGRLRQDAAPFNVEAMLDHQIALLEAELEWVSVFVEKWEAQAPPDEPPALPPEPDDIPRMKQVILPHDPDSPHRLPTRPLHPRDRSLLDEPPNHTPRETTVSHTTPPSLDPGLDDEEEELPPDDSDDD